MVIALRHFEGDVASNRLSLERSASAVSRLRGGGIKRKLLKRSGLMLATQEALLKSHKDVEDVYFTKIQYSALTDDTTK